MLRRGAEKGKYNRLYALLAGVLLGLFSETKVPVLTPILALSGILYIRWITGQFRTVPLFLLGLAAGYLAPYIPYFLGGRSVVEWLKVQKWVLSFYRSSAIPPTWGSVLTALFTGRYQNIYSHLWTTASEWSPVWGMTVLLIISKAKGLVSIKNRHMWFVLLATLALIIGFYAVIPFWTRYLVVVLPLLYLFGSWTISKLNPRLSAVVILTFLAINIVSSYAILFPSSRAFVQQLEYNLEHKLFSDIYMETTDAFRNSTDRETFRRHGMEILDMGEIEHIEVSGLTQPETNRSPQQTLTATITYMTRNLGPLTVTTNIPVVMEDNRWRIPWDWSVLIPGLTEKTRLITTVEPAKRGSILASDKKPLAEDAAGYLVTITPGLIKKQEEDAILSLLETVFDGMLPKVALHERIFGNTLSHLPVPVGVIPHPKTDPNVISLSRFSGVTFRNAYTRLYHPNNTVDPGLLKNTAYSECCSLLYSTTNYDGVRGVEKYKNSELKGINGGTLAITDEQGNITTTLLAPTKRDGINVEP